MKPERFSVLSLINQTVKWKQQTGTEQLKRHWNIWRREAKNKTKWKTKIQSVYRTTKAHNSRHNNKDRKKCVNMKFTGLNFNELYLMNRLCFEKRNCNETASRKLSKISEINSNESQKLNDTITLMCIENVVKLKTWLRPIENRREKRNQKKTQITQQNKDNFQESIKKRAKQSNRKWFHHIAIGLRVSGYPLKCELRFCESYALYVERGI